MQAVGSVLHMMDNEINMTEPVRTWVSGELTLPI